MKSKRYSIFELKLIGLIFLILDYVLIYINWGPDWLKLFTSFARPLLVFLLVESFYKQSSKTSLLKRLFASALLVSLGNLIINIGFLGPDPDLSLEVFRSLLDGKNFILTLAMFSLIMLYLEQIKKKENEALSIFLVFVFSLLSFFTEEGLILFPIMIVSYYFRKNKKRINLGILLLSLILLIMSLTTYFLDISSFSYEWALVVAILPISLYSGRRGRRDPFAKWFFYIFYPILLWLLYLINHLNKS